MIEFITVVIIVLFCLVVEGFFSGSELGFISVNRIKIKHLSESGEKGAQQVEELLKTPERIFGATSIGTNIAVVSSTAVVTAYLVELFGKRGDLYASIILFPVILLFGEIIPKTIFQQKADSLIIKIIRPFRVALKIFNPLVSIISKMTNYTLVLAAGKQGLKKHFITREELRAIAMPGLDQSELDSDDKKMIQKILDFRDVTAEECMTPLINLIAIDESSSADYAIQRSRESSYSRLLVFKERIYDITGIIHTFDLLKLPEDENSLKNIIQPAFYVPESKRVDDLFQQMQDKGDHMAVVVDEYGAAVGIITIEDMLEEIVGEIEDEFDKIPSLYEKKGKGFYEIKGEMEIDMINEELEIQLPSGDYETLSGLVTNKMGKIPKAEEILSLEEYQIIVKEADPRKVKLLEVKKKVNP